MTIIATNSAPDADAICNVMLTGGRVTRGFRSALFDAAARAGMSINEFCIQATAEKLADRGATFTGVFEPGDMAAHNDNQESIHETIARSSHR